VLAALIAPVLALAAGEAPSAREGATAVEIAIASSAPEPAARVRVDLEELLGRQGLDARYRLLSAVDRDEVLRPASLAPCSLACIWIDLGVARAGHALVYVSATAAEQVVIRALRLPNGLDEVAREEVSHIVASSVEALQAGRPLPVAPEPDASLQKVPPPPSPAAPATPAPPSSRWVAAGLAAGAARESSGVLAAPTLGLSVLVGAKDARWAPALWLTAAGFSSDANEAAGAPVALRFRGGELAALAAVGTAPGGRFAARVGLGGGLELRQTTPALANAASPDDVALGGSRLDPAVFVRAAARLEVPLFAPIGLFVVAACDARVVNARYVVDSDGTSDVVYTPSRLRPSLLAGVEATFGQGGAP
jgi:hypothetical protein